MARGSIKGITFEIGGDTTKLNKALKDVDGQLKSTQGNLRDVERALKMDPGNTDLIKQKQRLLGEEISKTKEKLDILKQADKTAKQQLANGEIGQDDYEALQREIAKTEANLKSYQKQLDNIPGTLDKVSSKMESAGGKMSSVGRGLTTGVTVPLGAASVASAKMSMDFEDAMAKVNTIADTTQIPLSDLESAIMDLSNQTGISSEEIAQNVYDAISAGQKTGDAVNFVSNSTKLAKAGFADAGSALDVLTTILNAYGMEAEEVSHVSDVLIQTQNLGKTTVGELSSSMGKIIPTAKANGVALEQVAAGYAIMTANGVATAETTTYMNSMLNELGKSGTKVSDTLKEKTGKSFSELMQGGASLSDVLKILSDDASAQGLAFGDLWGSAEAGKAGLILLGDSADNFNKTLNDMQNSTGATDSAFGKLDTNSSKIKITLNQLKNTAIEFGGSLLQVLAPMLEGASEKVKQFSEWFQKLSPETQQLIGKVVLMAAALGPLLQAGGKLLIGGSKVIGAISKIRTAVSGLSAGVGLLSSGALLPIIAVVGAVVAAGVLLYKNWDKIKEAAGKLGENIKEKWNGLKAKTKETWENVKTTVSDKMKEASENTKRELGAMKKSYDENGGGIKGIAAGMMTGVKLRFESGYKTLNTLTGGKLGELATKFKTKFGEIQTRGSDIMEGLKTTVGKGIERVKSFFNFNWSLPKIKMPHFSISGGFSLNPPSIPHFNVDWYDKGGIFSSPSVIGVGEKRPEFVGALDDLRTIVREESANAVSTQVLEIMEQMLAIMSGTLPEIANKGLSINEKSITRSAERGITQRQITNARARGKYV